MIRDAEPGPSQPSSRLDRKARLFLAFVSVVLCSFHSWLIWTAMGGWSGLSDDGIDWRDDHPLYFHSALVTRHFLAQTGTTAGYDPAFMAGYSKSVVFPASSTLPEVCIALTGGEHPAQVYKAYMFVSAASIPWLVWLASRLWRSGPGGACASVALFLVYVWTDFPIQYAAFGMLPYLLAIPLGLVALGCFCHYVEKGGLAWWLAAACSLSFMTLTHFTSVMIVGPAAAVVSLGAVRGFSRSRHLGVWSIPVLVVGLNAFWWIPGLWLWSTRGPSDFAFAHPEGFLQRIRQIATTEAPVERVVVVFSLLGMVAMACSKLPGPRKLGLAVFVAAGFFWGYMTGSARSFDFLQPGRHTFAFFSGLTIASGFGLGRALEWARERSRFRADVLGATVLVLAGIWHLGGDVRQGASRPFGPRPFLASRPSPWLLWVLRNVRENVNPGERLLYEEGGKDVPGVPDPFQGGRFSGLLADRLGIELIGGPYLHASLTTNFTQFGENKLFGKEDWDRDWFVRYARLYRPSAILCWTPKARTFCQANPDLIEIRADGGSVLLGRVLGFEGAAISGKAEVVASPGKLRVTKAEGGLDGTVVLRYHSVPCLRADPPVEWESVYLENDPVPFIKLRPPPGGGPVTFGMRIPPGSGK